MARQRRRARDINPRLGQAYDLLRGWRIGFYNDKLTPKGAWQGPATGRSLKPMIPLTAYQHRQLAALADRVNITHPYKVQGAMMPGGEPRYHFTIRATGSKNGGSR